MASILLLLVAVLLVIGSIQIISLVYAIIEQDEKRGLERTCGYIRIGIGVLSTIAWVILTIIYMSLLLETLIE